MEMIKNRWLRQNLPAESLCNIQARCCTSNLNPRHKRNEELLILRRNSLLFFGSNLLPILSAQGFRKIRHDTVNRMIRGMIQLMISFVSPDLSG